MGKSCNYNCSEPWPPYTPDDDITGIGVIVSYVATAGLSVLIIIIYYIAVHDPSVDPFEKSGEKTSPARPNPVDDFLLTGPRSGSRYLMKLILGSCQVKTHVNVRLERALLKTSYLPYFVAVILSDDLLDCLLVMSDLQIATGFAILLSGFAQLHCGLVAFKWRAILDLAWFSCLTHLACLTMLRGYLHAHTFERLWRLFATGSLAALLAVGLLFTANSDWDRVFRLKDNAPTLCIIGCNRSRSSVGDPVSFWTPVISATFLVVAFVSRVVRLHKVLSVDTFGRASDWLDFQGRRLLWVFFRLFCTEGDVYSLKRSLAYRPLFGIFMTLRLLLDLWASFAFEIFWGCLALAWGIWRLLDDLSSNSHAGADIQASKEDWTFGQLVSVIMLIAPLISIIGSLNNDTDIGRGQILQQSSNEPVAPREPEHLFSQLPIGSGGVETQDLEVPSIDLASHDSTIGTAIVYCIGVCLRPTTASFGSSPFILFTDVGPTVPIALYDFYCMVLCSLTIESAVPQKMHWLRRLLQSVNIGVFLTGWVFYTFSINEYDSTPLRSNFALFGVYVLCALVHRVIGWLRRRTNC